jgi:glycosyltransferase involved in cell wall biosynthesis
MAGAVTTEPGDQPVVLILTPVFNETAGLAAYETAVRNTLLSRTDCQVRVLFIDDGSADDSWRQIREIAARDGHFHGIRLSRNYGSHIALSAGFAHIGDADAVATLACDLQDPPEVVSQFIDAWKRGADIVWGTRTSRVESPLRIWTSRIFESLILLTRCRRLASRRAVSFSSIARWPSASRNSRSITASRSPWWRGPDSPRPWSRTSGIGAALACPAGHTDEC